MKQFEVFENPVVEARRFAPFIILLSSHLVPRLDDVIVAPLINDAAHRLGDLELEVHIEGQRLTLVVSELSTMRGRDLRRRIGSLVDREDDIRRALDRLFTGF